MSDMFFQLHRPTDDTCYSKVEDDQNLSQFEYSTYNYFDKARNNLIDFSSAHRNLRFGDGTGVPSPDSIDVDSTIKNGKKWTPRGVQQLAPRAFQAVPDLSGGSVKDTDEENKVRSTMHYDRSVALSGVYIDHQFEPLLPSISQEVQNTDHIVEPWVRGGGNTREASRSLSYLESQGYKRGDVSSSSGRLPPVIRRT